MLAVSPWNPTGLISSKRVVALNPKRLLKSAPNVTFANNPISEIPITKLIMFVICLTFLRDMKNNSIIKNLRCIIV